MFFLTTSKSCPSHPILNILTLNTSGHKKTGKEVADEAPDFSDL